MEEHGALSYFDGLTAASFKTDPQGRTVFYPWGTLGSGYVLEDEEAHERVRTFVKRFYKAAIPAIIPPLAALSLYGVLGILICSAVLMILILGWYTVAVNRITAGLAPSNEKLTVADTSASSAKAHSWTTLVLLTLGSFVFVAAGVFLVSVGNVLIGMVTIVSFGLCAGVFAYMIIVKRRRT